MGELNLPIRWALPSGISISQSYLEFKSTSIKPFQFSKTKINLRVAIKDKFDVKRQTISLMPNLIHSLDATSLSLLYSKFIEHYGSDSQFFSVHDCFGTTCDKVLILKTILASVYTDIYSTEPYLINFDKDILDTIETSTDYKVDRNKRIVYSPNRELILHDIEWVINKKTLDSKTVDKIDHQFLLV